MKRRITPEQLLELTEDQQQKLRDWWKPERGDSYYDDRFNKLDENIWIIDFPNKEYYLPLLDIGQLLEILELTIGQVQMSAARPDLQYVDFWQNDDELNFNEKELCDALWKAVKEVLKEEMP